MSTFLKSEKPKGRRSKGLAPKTASQAAKLAAQSRIENEQQPANSTRPSFWRHLVAVALIFIVAFLVNITLFSQLFHSVEQTRLRTLFRDQLTQAIAPTSEVDFDKTLLAQGAPVAVINIPQLGISEVVVEGTDSQTLRSGPGHRRDSVLPGQEGISIIMGRASSYGGPFGALQSLPTGTKFKVITGQGVQVFKSLGIRNAGDISLAPVKPGESRLILLTARGGAYTPVGISRLDAVLVSEVQPKGVRVTSTNQVPREDREFGFDLRFAWALVLTLQFLILAEALMIWSLSRFGKRSTYLVFTPTLLLATILVLDQITRLLPNLL
ncbi:MAG: hypothetical protein RLZ28_1315 [Actinomycetota bacterium]